MKLSKETIAVLKNFASINSGISFVEGNEIRVATIDKTLMGIAVVPESFPIDFAIYDLNQFLSVLSLFKEPDLEFTDDYVLIKEGRKRIKYYYTDIDNVRAASYELELGSGESSLFISSDQLASIKKASQILGLSDFTFLKDGDKLQMILEDSENNGINNDYTIDLEFELDVPDFEILLKIDSLNLLPFDYDIEIVNNQFLVFENKDNNVKYYVAAVE